MFLHRSLQWPSTPAFLSKLFHTSQSTPPNTYSPQEKSKHWQFPVIPLPTLSTLRSLLPSLKTEGDNGASCSTISAQHLQICINLVHHIFDICTLGCLWLFSPVFQVTLDIFGIRGAIKLWIHGLAIFLATTYGMYFLLWLAQEYIFQLASLYGILQTLVLTVSLRADRDEERAKEQMGAEQVEEFVEEREQGEDRWAGGSEEEGGDSEDGWESEGEEEEVGTD
ncbi:hypothetical protein XENTR_v10021276 [Xenopus tropicalis]|uniref:Uncharacterized protein C6orf47 homolog n=1 Tax=Xenopus tropicalis TaxID=8364 RepID=A0A8J0R6E1_XENTR|nr:uncharacterized protein C6orf47 homolog [Xenopus tropicalis]KAE8585317.1 hypothetical protein XENTR_v10021276 [Xenopus tropicalis]|eukprot:XP_004916984.1 PREDICTED: uncharacterized protein C6orf47 homolog [Xenopus tropicalis]